MKTDKSSTLATSSGVPRFTARQAEILNQSLDLIREQGLSGLTMRKVADRMGFSEPAIYRHFKTKQDLVLGIISRLEEDLIQPMRAIAADRQRAVVDRLADILTHHLDLIASNNALPILLFAEAASSADERLTAAMRHVFATYENLLIELLREGVAGGEINPRLDPADGAMMLIGAPSACALRMRLFNETSKKSRRRALVQYMKSGLLSPAEVKP